MNTTAASCLTVPSLAEAALAPGFCAYQIPVEIEQPRSILSLGTSDFLALERATSSVVHLFDIDNDGLADSRRSVAQAYRLNHGLAIHNEYLYASSDSEVYRWPITSSSTSWEVTEEESELIVNNINRDGQGGAPFGHTTRTLAFNDQGRLYISVGSAGNIDADSFRSRIRRFDLSDTAAFPLDFLQGEVFADGLRNEVGLAFDRHGDLWGVENSADNLERDDIGGDITDDNPAEELNRFKEQDQGGNWGYPQCWTEFNLPDEFALGKGTIWAWPSFLDEDTITDDECRANTIPPIMALQAHSAPLGIAFYHWKDPEELPEECPPNVAFPKEMDGYAFIAYHGSWNRRIPTGYKVVYVEMDESGNPIGDSPVDLLSHVPNNAQWESGFRPVDVDFDDCGRLLVSSDGTRDSPQYRGSMIVRIEHTEDESQVIEPEDDGDTAPSLASFRAMYIHWSSFCLLLSLGLTSLLLVSTIASHTL